MQSNDRDLHLPSRRRDREGDAVTFRICTLRVLLGIADI